MSLLEKYKTIPKPNPFTNVLLVDARLADYEVIVKSVNDKTLPIPYVYTAKSSDLLKGLKDNFESIERLAICFATPKNGQLAFIDNKPLFTSPTSENDCVELMVEVIQTFKIQHVDFLGCNTLLYPSWRDFYSLIKSKTTVDIGASSDETGNWKYGGDWVMESTSQDVELIYFNEAIEVYKYLLDAATPQVNVTNSVFSSQTDNISTLFYNGYMYCFAQGVVKQFDLSGNYLNTVKDLTNQGFFYAKAGSFSNGFYLFNSQVYTIHKLDLTTSPPTFTQWLEPQTELNVLNNPSYGSTRAIAVTDNYLYMSLEDPSPIVIKISLANKSAVSYNVSCRADFLLVSGKHVYYATNLMTVNQSVYVLDTDTTVNTTITTFANSAISAMMIVEDTIYAVTYTLKTILMFGFFETTVPDKYEALQVNLSTNSVSSFFYFDILEVRKIFHHNLIFYAVGYLDGNLYYFNTSSAPSAPFLTSATYDNRSITVDFSANNASVTGYDYSLDGGISWHDISSVSLTSIEILDLSACSHYNVGLKAIQGSEKSEASNFIHVAPLSVEDLLDNGYNLLEILEYGYQIPDLSLDLADIVPEIKESLQLDASFAIQAFNQYGLDFASIRRYGNFSINDFLNADVSASILPPGKLTVVKAKYLGKGKTLVTFALEDTLTPQPTHYRIYMSNQMLKIVDASETTTNADGTISLII